MLGQLKSKKTTALVLACVMALTGVIVAIGSTLAATPINFTAPLPAGAPTVALQQIDLNGARDVAWTTSASRATAWGTTNSTVARVEVNSGTTGGYTLRTPGVFTAYRTTTLGQLGSTDYLVYDSKMPEKYTITTDHISIKSSGEKRVIPITVKSKGGDTLNNVVTWTSSMPSVATVNATTGEVTAVTSDGFASIIGKFTDCYGQEQTIVYTVLVGVISSDRIVEDDQGNFWKPVDEPPYIWEKVDEDGTSKNPPEYLHDIDEKGPGDSTNPSIPVVKGEDGNYWKEDPKNIWTPVLPDGQWGGEGDKIWGGSDKKPGTSDDENVEKFGTGASAGYWASFGQNIYAQVSSNGNIDELTGGGVDKDPTSNPVRPIFDNREKDGYFYYGPVPDNGGDNYYIGDKRPIGGDDLVTSNPVPSEVHSTDQRYYRDENGNMVTERPGPSLPENVFEDGKGGYWKDNGDNTYTKVDPNDNFKPLSPEQTVWGGDDGQLGGSDDKPAVTGENGKHYIDNGKNTYIPVIQGGANNGKLDTGNPITGGKDKKPGNSDDHNGSSTPALVKDPDNGEWYLDNKNGTFDAYGPDGLIDTADDEKGFVKITPEMNDKVPPARDFDNNKDGYLNPDEKKKWEDAVEAEKAKTGDWSGMNWIAGDGFKASGWDWIIIANDDEGNVLVTTRDLIGTTIFDLNSTVYENSNLDKEMTRFYNSLVDTDIEALENGETDVKKITEVAQKSDYLAQTPLYSAGGGISKVVATYGKRNCFALSWQEANAYLIGKSYSRANAGKLFSGLGTNWINASGTSQHYWLRSPHSTPTICSRVTYGGNLDFVRNDSGIGVRPALWIRKV